MLCKLSTLPARLSSTGEGESADLDGDAVTEVGEYSEEAREYSEVSPEDSLQPPSKVAYTCRPREESAPQCNREYLRKARVGSGGDLWKMATDRVG